MKVLIQAYACSPDWGSEPGVGWNYALELAKNCQVHVIAEKRYEESINSYLEKESNDNLFFHFLAHSFLELKLLKSELTYYVGYRLWQRRAFLLGKELHSFHNFDLTHVLTYIGFRTPGYFWKLPVPCVWGPVGGAQNYPWNCLGGLTVSGVIRESCRNIINLVQSRMSIHYRNALKRSSIFVATEQTGAFLKLYGKKVVPVTGCRAEEIAAKPKSFNKGEPLKMLWSGLHLERKRLDLLLTALKDASFDFKLTVLGEGQLTSKWKKMALDYGLAGKTVFKGKVDHDEAMKMLHHADVFVFTSLRETSATVILESLCRGLPVVALAMNGVCDIVDQKCGYLVPVKKYAQIICDLKTTLEKIAQNKNELHDKSQEAILRAQHFTWKKNTEKVLEIYKAEISEAGT